MNVDASLAEEMAANHESAREFLVIVTLQQADDVPILRAHGVRPSLVYQSMPALAASLTADQIEAIAKLPQVKLIELDRKAWALDPAKKT